MKRERTSAAIAAVQEGRRKGGFLHVEDVWSTSVVLEIDAPHLGVREMFDARDEVVAFVHHVDEVFSTFTPHSLVSQLREGRLSEDDIERMADAGNRGAAELVQVIALCRKALFATRGTFDPWSVPGGFDPSGLVKGWAAGVALDILRKHGVRRAFVNAGGDVALMSDGEPWPTGITDPDDVSQIMKAITLSGGAIATSGNYERGAHIVNPHLVTDGTAVVEPGAERVLRAKSATVIGPDATLADAYATAVCIDGPMAMEWFMALGDEWSLYLVPASDARADAGGQRTALRYGSAFA